MPDNSSDFEKLKAAYLNSDEMRHKKFYADWLERDIKGGRIDGLYHLENLLQELEGYPLSQNIINYICELIEDIKFKPTNYENAIEHARMICVYLPVYEKALQRYRRQKPFDSTPREKAIRAVFSKMMKSKNLSPKTLVERMTEARAFARQHDLMHFLDEARTLSRGEREDLMVDFMAGL